MVYHKYFMIAMIKVLLMIRMKSCDDKNDDDADMTMLKLKIDQDFEIMCLMMAMMSGTWNWLGKFWSLLRTSLESIANLKSRLRRGTIWARYTFIKTLCCAAFGFF